MNPVYLDHAATTPIRDEVLSAMAPYASETFGNASSAHRWGQAARAALENARAELASAIGAKSGEIRFVRGGTESDNLAVLGSYRAQASRAPGATVVVTAIEHSAVLEAAAHLSANEGARVETLDVSPEGSLDLGALREAIASAGNLRVQRRDRRKRSAKIC